MQEAPTFVSDLAMVAGVAAATGMLAHVLGQPRILGYLLAGLIVGPSIPIPLFADPDRVEALAEFGVVLVMFAVGLEFRVSRLVRILPLSGFTGLVQVGTLIWAGATLGVLLGWGPIGAAFLGASIAISSTMVVTSILAQQPLQPQSREHVLGVLVFQDVVAIALIAATTALAAGQALAARELTLVLVQLAGVLVGMLGLGMLIVPRLVRWVVASGGPEGIAVLSVGLAFVFAELAELLGYSVALGAFVAGILVAESGHGQRVEHAIAPLKAVFAAIFFVSIGMAVDLLLALRFLPVGLLVAATVILAQLASVGVASVLSGASLRQAVVTGLALGQIGEFSFIIATIGADAGVVPDALLPTLVTVATITAFTTAALLRRRDSVVHALDRAMPARLQHLIALHQAWMERLRASRSDTHPFRRTLLVLLADWTGLVVLAVASLALDDATVRIGAGLLSLPLLVGAFRTARHLARTFAREVSPAESPASQLLEALAWLVLLLGVGMPALALLRPLVPGPWAEPVLLVGVLVAGVVVWRKLGAVEGELRSGAEQLARLLDRPGAAEEPHHHELLDHVVPHSLAEGDHAVGKTLAELDVRARTGATVVAIHKPDADVVLPTGHERLQAGDVLALTGTSEAVRQARALLDQDGR